VKKITIHCSDTPNRRKTVTSELIHKWHTEDRGWSAIGYHYVILRDGQVDSRQNKEFFRGLNTPGAHVRGNNKDNIGICMVGRDKFTKDQFWSLHDTYRDLKMLYNIPEHSVYCHYEFNHNKSCPNMRNANLIAWLLTGRIEHIKEYLYKER
jgi:N-acetylmuramoyl-L-alanine amidase